MNELFKIYQLLDYFVTNYGYFKPVESSSDGGMWIANRNHEYCLIRISLETFEETNIKINTVNEHIKELKKLNKLKGKVLDIHILRENLKDNIVGDSISINSNFYSGIDVSYIFSDIKKAIYEVEDQTVEIKNRIKSINKSLVVGKTDLFTKFLQAIRPSVTNIVILICVIVFVLLNILKYKGFSDSASLIVMGGDYKFFTLGLKEFYRLFTYAFVHSSFAHILFNMFSLYYIGNFVEDSLGKIKYIILLSVSIIVSGLTHGILTDNQLMVGMSGAIYSLFVYLIIINRSYSSFDNRRLIYLLLINLTLNFIPGVAWQTHLGGAITGFIFYFIYNYDFKERYISLIVIVLCVLTYKYATIKKITPLFLGTDLEVVEIYKNIGFDGVANSLEGRIYNYYLNN